MPLSLRIDAGVLTEALVRTFLPQERRLRLAFEAYIGDAIETHVMTLCNDYLNLKFVTGQMSSTVLEELLPCAVNTIERIEELKCREYSDNVLLKTLQAMCTNSSSNLSDSAKLNGVRGAVYCALAYLLETHYQAFMASTESQEVA